VADRAPDPARGLLFPADEEEEAPVAGFARVALNRPLHCEFTYSVPPALAESARPGVRVAVPFGSRRLIGVIVATEDGCDLDPRRIRPLADVLDAEPMVDAGLLELTRWFADYYACSWGQALSAVLPGSLKREGNRRRVRVVSVREGVGETELAEVVDRFPKQHRLLRTLLEIGAPVELRVVTRRLKISEHPCRSLERRGWVTIERVVSAPDPLLSSGLDRERPEQLSDQQETAVGALVERLEQGEYGTFLLQGVTGSGKTEVYLRVIERALELGRGAIVLVPEIALTPQTVSWFRSRFGDVAILHSGMTDAQRLDMWMRARSGAARVVVGARSAIFAPVPDLGVIVVDEEHEPSFKQESVPRYHARDIAVVRARALGAVCVLGSATPSLESWKNAREERYERLALTERVSGRGMPVIEIVDMRREKPDRAGPKLFSRRLRTLLEETLERGKQSILFLNRRGFAPVLWCRECGESVRCRQCDVTLTFHRRIGRAVCHCCCEEVGPPKACPACTAPALHYLGGGSERVESSLGALLPEARVARMDSDTMLRREDYERTLESFGRGELDVLVGTQMIAKGLDFPNVVLVGIVAADSALHLPDFRAAERTYQLLAQVSGRAGRGADQGRIVVQTCTPDHPAIQRAARNDFEGFCAQEEALRGELGYPPHARLIRVVFEDEDAARAGEAAERCAHGLEACAREHGGAVLGPAPAPIAMLRGRHRRHLLLKLPARGSDAEAGSVARGFLIRFAEESTRTRVLIDVDPVSML
jgi:primosomal protein N' (replication factor Y)